MMIFDRFIIIPINVESLIGKGAWPQGFSVFFPSVFQEVQVPACCLTRTEMLLVVMTSFSSR